METCGFKVQTRGSGVLPDSDREHILFALDALIRDAKARLAYS